MGETRARPRAVWRNIHLWIGLGLFVVLAPLGLSGSLLVWNDALEAAAHPARLAVTGGSPSPGIYLAAAVRAFAGQAAPAQLRMPETVGRPVTVVGYKPAPARPGQRPASLTVWIDPGSGRVLDVGDPRAGVMGVAHRLHGNLLLAARGRPLVGWLGMAMLTSSLTGLCLWWPRNNRVLKALRWTRTGSGYSNLHQMTGFWVCIPLAALSLSGAAIAFPQVTRAIAGTPSAPAGPNGGRDAFSPPLARTRMNLDEAVATATQTAGAGARLQTVTLPTAGDKSVWRVRLLGANGKAEIVRVDDATGAARVEPARADGPGGGDPLLGFMRRLHDGSAYGPVWRWIITLTGLAPTLLGLTGAVMWWARRGSRAA